MALRVLPEFVGPMWKINLRGAMRRAYGNHSEGWLASVTSLVETFAMNSSRFELLIKSVNKSK